MYLFSSSITAAIHCTVIKRNIDFFSLLIAGLWAESIMNCRLLVQYNIPPHSIKQTIEHCLALWGFHFQSNPSEWCLHPSGVGFFSYWTVFCGFRSDIFLCLLMWCIERIIAWSWKGASAAWQSSILISPELSGCVCEIHWRATKQILQSQYRARRFGVPIQHLRELWWMVVVVMA